MLPERYHRRMASISRDDVEHVAHLARLHLTDDEIDRMQTQLSNILEAIETLRDVDTSQVGPTASVIQLENVMRDDVATAPMPRGVALANAPLRDDPFLRVPTVLEEGR
jgi:aspartyl-tRNA(Asn)/glutamyl-tRNA(Gln) amidotransferase subunit C